MRFYVHEDCTTQGACEETEAHFGDIVYTHDGDDELGGLAEGQEGVTQRVGHSCIAIHVHAHTESANSYTFIHEPIHLARGQSRSTLDVIISGDCHSQDMGCSCFRRETALHFGTYCHMLFVLNTRRSALSQDFKSEQKYRREAITACAGVPYVPACGVKL